MQSIDSISSNKRIVKNTLMLYIRMGVSMLVSLYTSRIVLATLGVEDYGIYNVVGGVVVLFSFLSSALTAATQRFLTIELGKNDLQQFNKIFSISLLIYAGLALCIVFLAETIGLWFLNTQLNIPENRMVAANWIYQFSIISCALGLLQTPYNASIIAHERMSFYAYISIMDVVLKLGIVYLLLVILVDKLILYSILISVVGTVVLLVYIFYCRKTFQECRFKYCWDKGLFRQLLSFSGWSLFGGISNVATNQGVNILLNIFYGVVVNTAMGITNQVSGAINGFVSNFQMAFNPRITKTYAEGNKTYLESLMFRTAKMSFYLLLLLSLPVLIKTETILNIWLGQAPQYTVWFIRFILLATLVESLSAPLWMTVQATGKIKKYYIIISSLNLLNLVFSWILLLVGCSPISVVLVKVFVSILLLVSRALILKDMIQFRCWDYIKNVVFKCFSAGIIAFVISYICGLYRQRISGLIIVSCVAILSTLIIVYLIGLNMNERKLVRGFVQKKISHWSKFKEKKL